MAPRPLALCAPPKGRSTVARSLVIERAHRWWAPRAVAPLSRDFTVTDVEEDRGRELCTEEKQMTGFSRLDGFFLSFIINVFRYKGFLTVRSNGRGAGLLLAQAGAWIGSLSLGDGLVCTVGWVGSYLQASQVLRCLIWTTFGRRIVIPKFFLICCVLV